MKLSSLQNKIIKEIGASNKPLSAKEIHSCIKDSDLVTIYRNLAKLVESNNLKELTFKKGESLYEINHDSHQHAICNVCGKIEHIDIDTSDIIRQLKENDFDVDDIEIVIKGKCQSKN